MRGANIVKQQQQRLFIPLSRVPVTPCVTGTSRVPVTPCQSKLKLIKEWRNKNVKVNPYKVTQQQKPPLLCYENEAFESVQSPGVSNQPSVHCVTGTLRRFKKQRFTGSKKS